MSAPNGRWATTRHELQFGSIHVGRPRLQRYFPRCSCGWSGRETRGLFEMVTVWLSHVQWSEIPGCRIVAEVDDVMRAAFVEVPA